MPRDTSSDFHFLIGRSCRLNDIRVGIVGGEGLLVPLPKERNASIVLFTSAYRVKSRFSARVTRDLPLSSEFLRPIVLICHRKSLPLPAASRIYRRESSKANGLDSVTVYIHPPRWVSRLFKFRSTAPPDSAVSSRTKKGRSICIPSRVRRVYFLRRGEISRFPRKSVIATVTSWNIQQDGGISFLFFLKNTTTIRFVRFSLEHELWNYRFRRYTC